MSVGAGGARITAGPRGTHVSFSKAGFYYRTRLDGPLSRETRVTPSPTRDAPIEFYDQTVAAPVESEPTPRKEVLGDTSSDDVLTAINNRIKRRNYAIPIGALISAALFALSVPWPVVAAVGPLTSILAYRLYRRSRYSDLTYTGDEEETGRRLETLHKAVAALLSADSVWSVSDANPGSALLPHPPALNRTKIAGESPRLPEYIRTNITPATLQVADCTLCFFPDRLFVWHSGRFAAIDYAALKLRYRRITFVEREQQPPDALVESQMRRSILEGSTIPALYYGMVDIDASPAFHTRLMTSSLESAQEFVAHIQVAAAASKAKEEAETSKEPVYTHFDPARIPLFWSLTDQSVRQLQAAREAFALITQCACVWQNQGEQRTDDWKRNAGAGTLVTRSRVYPTLADQIPGYESNAVIGFSIGTATLYVLPDGFVVRTGDHFQALGTSLSVNPTTCSFREEEVSPGDGQVIGKTWRYVNKKGGPDLRFNDNREIPIYRYGQLDITCGSWRLHLCLSRADAAEQFATAIRSAFNRDERKAGEQRSEIPPLGTGNAPESVTEALRSLALGPRASLEDASASYKTLAAQNHPDKVAHMAPEFCELAERRMRELNAAHEIVRNFYHPRS